MRGAQAGAGRRHRQTAGTRAHVERAGRGRLAGRGAQGARPGQGCALGALGLFSTWFDSVLFLSQFLDIVREPGS